jgi:hypothetical protein
MVRRDRNHPSIFVWSVGNEIGTSVDESRDGMSFGRLAATREMVLKQDATRPVGIACHTPETVSQAVYDPLDLTGWNYPHRYDNYRAMYPDKPILYSESASAFSTRGFYAFPMPNAKSDYPAGTQYLTSLILLLCSLEIRFFPGQFNGKVDVTQPLHLGFQHAAEKNDLGCLGQEVRVLVDQRHALEKLRQGSFGGRPGDRFGRRG